MEIHVLTGEFCEVPVCQRQFHPISDDIKTIGQFVLLLRRQVGEAEQFKHHADIIELLEVLPGDAFDDNALSFDFDQTFVLKPAQRFPDRSPAQSELHRDLVLRQSAVVGDFTRQNFLTQFLGQFITESGAFTVVDGKSSSHSALQEKVRQESDGNGNQGNNSSNGNQHGEEHRQIADCVLELAPGDGGCDI